jgi:hypothetical protein
LRRPLGIGRSFRVSHPSAVSRSLVSRSRFAVHHSAGCPVFPRRAVPNTLSARCILSSSFAFLQSLAQHDLVRRPKSADTSHGLSLPSAHQESEVHSLRALPQPATFRPQGLATLSATYSLRARAGSVSHRRRSWDSPFGASSSRKVPGAFPRRAHPHTVFPVVVPGAEARAGPTSRGFRALTLSRVPGDRTGVNSPTAGCSLGFCPSRACWRTPGPGFRPDSSRALCSRPPRNGRSPAPRSLARSPLGLDLDRPANRTGGRSSPSRVLAPVRPEA